MVVGGVIMGALLFLSLINKKQHRTHPQNIKILSKMENRGYIKNQQYKKLLKFIQN